MGVLGIVDRPLAFQGMRPLGKNTFQSQSMFECQDLAHSGCLISSFLPTNVELLLSIRHQALGIAVNKISKFAALRKLTV